MKQIKWWIKVLMAIWIVSFFWVEGERVWRKLVGKKEKVVAAAVIQVQDKNKRVVVQTDDVFWWMRFNFENWPVVAERVSLSDKIPEGFDLVIRVRDKAEVVGP